MKSLTYIGFGVVSAIVGFLVLGMVHSDDEMQDAMSRADALIGSDSADRGSDAIGNLIGGGFIVAAIVLVLIGVIGLGVQAGRDDS